MARRDNPRFPGRLQQEIMRIVWRLGSCRVEDVRRELPRRHRGAYTTVQTVLNRLAERGLLARERDGKAIIYTPRISEGDYLARSLNDALSGASPDARRAALARLVGDLDRSELDEIRDLARETRRRRGRS